MHKEEGWEGEMGTKAGSWLCGNSKQKCGVSSFFSSSTCQRLSMPCAGCWAHQQAVWLDQTKIWGLFSLLKKKKKKSPILLRYKCYTCHLHVMLSQENSLGNGDVNGTSMKLIFPVFQINQRKERKVDLVFTAELYNTEVSCHDSWSVPVNNSYEFFFKVRTLTYSDLEVCCCFFFLLCFLFVLKNWRPELGRVTSWLYTGMLLKTVHTVMVLSFLCHCGGCFTPPLAPCAPP